MSDDTSPPLALLEKAFARHSDAQLPLHAKIYRGLRYAIENFFEDGQKFFTEKELIENLKVSQVTVRRAVYDLVRDGLLERRVAKGSYVRKKPKVNRDGRQSFAIAVHLTDWDSSFLSQLLRRILGACNSRHFDAKVFYSRQSGEILSKEGETFDQSEVSGAILISPPPDLAAGLCSLYEGRNIPVVSVDNNVPGEHAHFVGTDNQAVVKLGLDHLCSFGHEKICLLLNEPETHENVMLRARYFEEECKRRRLTGWSVAHCGTKFWEDSYEKAFKKMPEIMAPKSRPTAIFAFDDPGAWAVLKWCTQNSVRVPEDVSVLGFANDKPSAFTHPALTTIAHPISEIASAAMDLLTFTSKKRQVRLLQPGLVARESTGPVA